MARARLKTETVRRPDLGVIRSAPFEQVDPRALMDAQNVRARPGRIEKVKGWDEFSATALPGAIMLVDVARFLSGTEIMIVADTKRAYKYNTSTGVLDDITASDLTTSDAWPHFAGMWKDYWIYTNALSLVKKWSGALNLTTLAGLATDAEPGGVAVQKAKVLCPAGPFLLIGNTTEDGSPYLTRVRWNKFDVLEVWKNDASGNGQAGYMDVSEEASEIKNIVPLGNYYAVYKQKSVHLLTYVGLPFVWARRQVVVNRGLIAPKAIVSLGDFHVCAFTDNFYIFNGATLQRIGDPIRDDFFADLNPNKKDLMFAFHLEDKAEVVFAYPSLSATVCDKAWVYNYITNAWTPRDFPFAAGTAYLSQLTTAWQDAVGTWGAQTIAWSDRTFLANAPVPIVGSASTKKIYQYDTTDAKAGAAIDGYLTSVFSDFGFPDRVKRLLRIKPVCEKLDVDMLVYVITGNNSRGDSTENGPYAYNPSTDEFVDVDHAARFIAVKFRSANANEPFTVSGWFVEFELQEDR